jgi:alcohol dehydrogenase
MTRKNEWKDVAVGMGAWQGLAVGTFRVPTEVVFGDGIANELGVRANAHGRRAVLVSDPGVARTGLLEPLKESITAAGMTFELVTDISPNPRDTECEAVAVRAREFGAEVIIAVGGGSPIDAAKCASAVVTNGGPARALVTPRPLQRDPLPLIAVPTTAGTGSEVTRGAVITDTERHVKFTVKDPRMAPRLALVDPLLTLSVPPSVTAATGMDVLTHAVEAYTCRRATLVTDPLALSANELVAQYLERVVADGQDREARSHMMMASLIAGLAFSNADVAAVHCLAEALGGRYDTPHGVANAVFLPAVFRYNITANPPRHARVAAALGVDVEGLSATDAARLGADALAELSRRVGIPRFRDLAGVNPDEFPAIAAAAEQNTSTPSNARRLDARGFLELLRETWAGESAH